jgi:serine protease Do
MTNRLAVVLAVVASCVSSPVWAQPRAHTAQSYAVQKTSGGFLGIGALDITAERAKALNLKEERGVEVSTLAEDGPAAKAGIKENDVVLEFNGQPVQGTAQFQRLVRETPVGRQVKITVWRAGTPLTLTATVGENKQSVTVFTTPSDGTWHMNMPSLPAMPNMEMPRLEMSLPNPMLGIVGEELGREEQLAEFFGVTEGILVRSVRKGSAAEKAGLKAGDVITKVDDSKVTTSSEITRTLRGLKGKKSIIVMVTRNRKEMALPVMIESGGGTGANRAGIWAMGEAL